MSLLDLFRQEYVKGKVVDKYSLKNGNIGLIIDDYGTHKRYHVEFRDGYKGPSAENLFGIVKDPFSKKTEYLDKLIIRSSKNWRLERMPIVDRCILRLGVFEIFFMEDIPPKVSIDEAVELGKKFGTEDSGAFINGVLDNIFNKLKPKGQISYKKRR